MAEWALMPLRLFLGVTFIYAGLQKLANPNFFRAASPISIQAQLIASSHTSPLHAILHTSDSCRDADRDRHRLRGVGDRARRVARTVDANRRGRRRARCRSACS